MLKRYCHMDLKTAASVIASFGIICSVLAIILFNTSFIIIISNNDTTKEGAEITPTTTSLVVLVVGMLIIGINLCASIGLLYGIRKEKTKLMLPWLVLMATNTFLLGIELTLALFPIGANIAIFLGIAFCLYTWLAIYTLYYEMKTEAILQAMEP